MENLIIRPKQLAEILGVSVVTLWRWRQAKIIPEPILLGVRFVGWKESTIIEWLKDRENSVDDQTPRN